MPENAPGILVIEDETSLRNFLRLSLTGKDFKVWDTETGKEGLSLSAANHPDVVLLDLGLPDMDGLDVVRRLREWSHVPIIILSMRGKEQDKIQALEEGADDYLTKPFDVGELTARIRVALRHARRAGGVKEESVFQVGGLKVDQDKHRVSMEGKEIHLSPQEYKLLSILVRNAGRLITQKELLAEIWGPAGEGSGHYLRIYIYQLRHKLEKDPAQPRYILTETGVGYRLAESVDPA